MNALLVSKPVRHRAKVDWWVAPIFGGMPVLQIVLATAFFLVALPAAGIIAIVAAAFLSLFLWGCYHTRYEITTSDLIVRYGPFRTTVELQAIVGVFPTRNPLSAPAPSLDRLQIDYRKNGVRAFVLISPKDKEGFVRDLAIAASQLRSVGGAPLRLQAELGNEGRPLPPSPSAV
jgi:hypothetical protein